MSWPSFFIEKDKWYNTAMNSRNLIAGGIGLAILTLLYWERALIEPIVLAGVFAYILSPLVRLLHQEMHVPRMLSVICIYLVLISAIILAGNLVVRQVNRESLTLDRTLTQATIDLRRQALLLPDWARPTVLVSLNTLNRSRIFTLPVSPSMISINEAIARLTSFFVFAFSGFYFLKDGETMIQNLISIFPEKNKEKLRDFFAQVNHVLHDYLRGQLFLIFFVAVVLYVALTLLGVKFALTLAIFSGFAEIVPFIGPLVAGAVAVFVILLTGGLMHISLPLLQETLIVVLIYFIVRQFEDYVVMPFVLGKFTKLPAFVIFFAVIIGGHMAGVLGMILAVPLVAMLRVLIGFFQEGKFSLS